MTHVPHELAEEFSEYQKELHDLRLLNEHFRSITDKYHVVNREIHRIEAGTESTSDFYMEKLKKRRLALKDEIYGFLKDCRS